MRDSSLFRSNDADDAAAVVAKLDDSDGRVREAVSHVRLMALDTLGKLEAAAIADHAAALVDTLKDSEWHVRLAAVQTLSKLEAAALAEHAVAALVDTLEDSEWRVRQAAVQTLGKLERAGRETNPPVSGV